MTHADELFDVVIAGFGPSGATAAGLLGAHGFRVLVVERQTEVYDKPRAIALDHEIFRHFDNMGVADAVRPYVAPFTASQHFGAQGQLIRTIDMVQPPYPLGYTPSMVFTQPPVEAALRAHAAGFANVSIVTGAELIGFEERGEEILATLRAEDGMQRQIRGKFLLGCDGASSTVRQLADMALRDLIFDEPWLVVDIRCGDAALAKLPQCSAQFCDPARPTTYIIGPGNHRRWEIMLLPGENPREMAAPEQVWRLLAGFMAPSEGELWRAAAYRFHALVAQSWRRGRVLIAGDAAHQQPPFIGQGMCQGLRDVTNLVWKLARVLRGQSPLALLDSYEAERRLHVETLTGKIKAIGQMICERDPARAAARDEDLLAQGGGVPPHVTRQDIVPPLETGLLAPPGNPGRGLLFVQPLIRQAGGAALLDRLTGTGWRLILDGRVLRVPDLAALLTPADEIGLYAIAPAGAALPDALEEQDGVMAAWFDRHQVQAMLVRPDHYVFGTAANAQALPALLATCRAQLACAEPIHQEVKHEACHS